MTAPALSTRARRVLDEAQLAEGTTIVVACSGGIDSQTLLDVLAHVVLRDRRRGLCLHAHAVDHGLRASAVEEIELARVLASARGVPFTTERLEVAAGGNLQARARDARWRSLRRLAASFGAGTRIATGHHRDDRAETVLIKLLRGGPLDAFAVLPAVEGDRLRPLIEASRVEVTAHAARRALDFARDPSNDDPRFLRSRVRHELLPLLESLDPAVRDHLTALAAEACARTGPTSARSRSKRGRT
ncbi:MAG: tRNA lysidine(34) synthetase TilS [Polyangiales bacterium]